MKLGGPVSDRESRRVLRFLASHGVSGLVAGWALMLGLIWTDVGRNGSLIHSSSAGQVGFLMLIVAFGATGAAIGIGVGAMSLGEDRDR